MEGALAAGEGLKGPEDLEPTGVLKGLESEEESPWEAEIQAKKKAEEERVAERMRRAAEADSTKRRNNKPTLYFARHALSHAATLVVLDGPLDQDLGGAREVLQEGGYDAAESRLVPLNLSGALLTPEAAPPELYVQEEEGGAHWRHCKAAGAWKSTRESEGDVRVILSPMSSGPDYPLWHPDEVSGHYPVLLEDTRGDGAPRVRRCDPKEARQISGGLLHDWREGTRAGVPEEVLLMGAARPMPPVSARQVLWAAASAREGLLAEGARAGVCRDPDGDFMAAANATWFNAWKANPEDPRTAYERWLREARGARAGGHLADERERLRGSLIFGNLAKGDEDVLLDWIVHLAHVQHRSEGTIRGKLMAVRHCHIAAGYPDPLELAPRLALALGGLRRMGAKQNRKYPLERLAPQRWTSEGDLPLFRDGDGNPIRRKDITDLLGQAAKAKSAQNYNLTLGSSNRPGQTPPGGRVKFREEPPEEYHGPPVASPAVRRKAPAAAFTRQLQVVGAEIRAECSAKHTELKGDIVASCQDLHAQLTAEWSAELARASEGGAAGRDAGSKCLQSSAASMGQLSEVLRLMQIMEALAEKICSEATTRKAVEARLEQRVASVEQQLFPNGTEATGGLEQMPAGVPEQEELHRNQSRASLTPVTVQTLMSDDLKDSLEKLVDRVNTMLKGDDGPLLSSPTAWLPPGSPRPSPRRSRERSCRRGRPASLPPVTPSSPRGRRRPPQPSARRRQSGGQPRRGAGPRPRGLGRAAGLRSS
ncbi:unnamed protein product [Prorocentrum cordatum]|uniref:RNA-directed RNA polymerase n=1 Tax=Prorocentrum cordatum TaxID=2364126 RepID=A0ABN9TYK5_9DINO|nr:unnamed protein product [Polarella glacialis]